MRTEEEMWDLILSFASNDDRIRVVGMEGSRTNINVPKDIFQDYDITYLVTDIESFSKDDTWLDYFGERLIMQKPDTSTLFPVSQKGFAYLMQFTDGNRIDLKILSVDDLDYYLSSDKLLKILLDKDQKIKNPPLPTDLDYQVQKPTQANFHDSCNEFWWVSTYVVKGLCRKEILYAIYHLNLIRNELLRMITWMVGIETNFSLSVGKNYKYLNKYVDKEVWKTLLSTYKMDNYQNVWDSLFTCQTLFIQVSLWVAQMLGFDYPDYDQKVLKYIQDLYNQYKPEEVKK